MSSFWVGLLVGIPLGALLLYLVVAGLVFWTFNQNRFNSWRK